MDALGVYILKFQPSTTKVAGLKRTIHGFTFPDPQERGEPFGPNGFPGYTPPKPNMTGWKLHHEWVDVFPDLKIRTFSSQPFSKLRGVDVPMDPDDHAHHARQLWTLRFGNVQTGS